MIHLTRRQAVLSALALAAGSSVRAQGFPAKPIRIIVGYSAGGAVDIIARAIGQHLQGGLGQPVIVENKPGAGTNIATKALIDSPPDGHTVMLAANALAANAQSSIDSIKTLIAQSKAKPESVDYGTPGNGSTPHLAVELFERAAGVRLMHVPYKGGSAAINDVIAGHIQTVAVNALEVLPHVKSGKLCVLAVLSDKRSPIFPEAPTIAESGFPGFEASVWYGLVAPAGTPPAAIARLHQEVQRALAAPDVRERLASAGGDVAPGSSAMFAELVRREQQRYEKLIRDAHIKID